MSFVLDASSALPWCFADEATTSSELLLGRARDLESIFVPSHWPLEILNGLTRAARRGRVEEASVDSFLLALASFRIQVDARSIEVQWKEARALVLMYRLSAYDAAYLSLAKRLQIPLATSDERLQEAALKDGVALLG